MKSDQDDIQILEIQNMGKIRLKMINNQPWFVGRDVSTILGYRNTSKAIINHVDNENKIFIMISQYNSNDKIQYSTKTVFINETGLFNLIFHSKTKSAKEKEEIINYFKSIGILKKYNLYSRKEINFKYKLKQALKPFGLKIIPQFQCLNYKIDFYIKSLNIAIEYDENDHRNYSYERHEGRQREIEKELGCRFIRISDKNTDEYNIGYVIKEIFEL